MIFICIFLFACYIYVRANPIKDDENKNHFQMKLTLFGKIAMYFSISLLIYLIMGDYALIGYIVYAVILFIIATDKAIKSK